MTRNDHIVLLDPSLKNNKGHPSDNIGDIIISDSNLQILQDLFPNREIIRYSTHSFFEKSETKLINLAEFCFVGGTNLLHSNMLGPRIFMMRKGHLLWLFPGISNLILMGVGWGYDYMKKVNIRTKILYRNILHPSVIHSVRDSYTAQKLKKCSGRNVINTACLTMSKLNGFSTNLDQPVTTCLFTLTDYNQDISADQGLITQLLNHFQKLFFFPQGTKDLEYISSLETYKKNYHRIKILAHSYQEFCDFLKTEEFVYIGTRLHAGIKCINEGKKGLIIGVDNRAKSIALDTNLPVLNRNDKELINNWLNRERVFKDNIRIPIEAIEKWKNQFK